MITVREMQIDDIDQVCEIENENFSVPWSANGFFTYLIREDALFLAACDGEEVVGYCGLICVPDEGDITNVAVAKRRWGEGIGTELVSAMIEKGVGRGVKNIFLEVRRSNERAIALYEKLGFRTIGERKNYYELPKEDALLMKREGENDV